MWPTRKNPNGLSNNLTCLNLVSLNTPSDSRSTSPWKLTKPVPRKAGAFWRTAAPAGGKDVEETWASGEVFGAKVQPIEQDFKPNGFAKENTVPTLETSPPFKQFRPTKMLQFETTNQKAPRCDGLWSKIKLLVFRGFQKLGWKG